MNSDMNSANAPKIYFSDFFRIEPEVIDDYGAFNISLINDLPLFIDPFLLFDSEEEKYKSLHNEIITYLKFLRDQAVTGNLSEGNLSHRFLFKEVKQNWFGWSRTGNGGTGLGKTFALTLSKNFRSVFTDFGDERTTGSHIEKLSLLDGGVGRDHLSDFTTNLIKHFLLDYTQTFARAHLADNQKRYFKIEKVKFDYRTKRWKDGTYELPYIKGLKGEYVLLTPKEILTRDEAWINQGDMLDQFTQLRMSLPDEMLRAQINDHFYEQINEKSNDEEKRKAALKTITQFHQILDFYIQKKEREAPQAHVVSNNKVKDTHDQFIKNVTELVTNFLAGTEFYEKGNSYIESLERVHYLKHVIENNDGYKVFYQKGTPIKRESDLHTMFRLTWFATTFDVNSEVNNGRGPVDYKVSLGSKDKTIVEFKLASNTGLKRNLAHQVKIYENANTTQSSIKVIMCFSDAELEKTKAILKDLNLHDKESVILIDANNSNKPSASTAG